MVVTPHNPYTSPKPTLTELLDPAQRSTRGLGRSLARWTLICAVSAAPSFFWGAMIHPHTDQILAMLLGIITYILVYTAVDCGPISDRILEDPIRRRTVKIGYGTRLILSVLFPIGIVLDMFLGAVAVSLIAQGVRWVGWDLPIEENAPWWIVYVTTLLQGALLNLLLFAYMLVIWGIQWFWRATRKSTPLVATVLESPEADVASHPFTETAN